MELPASVDHVGGGSMTSEFGHGFVFAGMDFLPEQKTAKQIIADLRLRRGVLICCTDGINRPVRKITDNGDVFVRGTRDKVDVHALRER